MVMSFLVVGDVVIDIIADLGFNLLDIPIGASIDIKGGKITPGGGGNIASALAYLGVKAGFVGKCGRDVFCNHYKVDLESYGVTPHLLESNELPTGYVISVITENGERTMIVNPGANADLGVEDFEGVMGVLTSYDALFIHGYSLQRRKQADAIMHLAEHFVERGKMVYLDPSTKSLIASNRGLVEDFFSISQGIFLNEDEAAEFVGSNHIEDIVDGMKDVADLVVLKLGFKGSMVIHNGETKIFPPYIVKPKDTTGAGDSYNAAFLAMIARGMPIEVAGDFANWFASRTITEYGPRTFPDRSEVEEKLRGYGVDR